MNEYEEVQRVVFQVMLMYSLFVVVVVVDIVVVFSHSLVWACRYTENRKEGQCLKMKRTV